MQAERSSPDHIFEIGYAFWKSKALLTAVEFDLFTVLAERPLGLDEFVARLGLAGRGALDFLDAVVSMDLIVRDAASRYANTPNADRYLNRTSSEYIGAALERLNSGGYPPWGALGTALRTGVPQNTQIKDGYG